MNDETTETPAEETDAEAWKAAKIVGTEEEAAMAVGFLNSNGIEAQVESLHASEFPTDFGHLGEVHVMVPPEQLEEAQRLLAQVEAESAAAPAEDAGE
jgi:Putative prokaryotic signal transducing protein